MTLRLIQKTCCIGYSTFVFLFFSSYVYADGPQSKSTATKQAINTFASAFDQILASLGTIDNVDDRAALVRDTREAVCVPVGCLYRLLFSSNDPRSDSNNNIVFVTYSAFQGDIEYWSRLSRERTPDAARMIRMRVAQTLRLYPVSTSPQKDEMILLTQILAIAAGVDTDWIKKIVEDRAAIDLRSGNGDFALPFLVVTEVLSEREAPIEKDTIHSQGVVGLPEFLKGVFRRVKRSVEESRKNAVSPP